MSNFRAGPKEAAAMLAGLDLEAQQRVIQIMEKKDPQMAELLKQQMVTLEDLKYMTVKMLQEFLGHVELIDLSLALRLGSQELKDFFLKNVSRRLKEEILEVIDGPARPKSEVVEAHEKVMSYVRKEVEAGKLVLRPNQEEYV